MTTLSASDSDISAAARHLKAGGLVAMPTETVYGLGADATNELACCKIYAVKGRPATDPLICHVHCLERVSELWDQSTPEAVRAVQTAMHLGRYFWPGPLTVVAKASGRVAPSVTGGSGFVGVRIPNHSVALKFLEAVDVPVAAPSANTFGHVSPTCAQHVIDDLAQRDKSLLVIDGGASSVGIESTVVKVNEAGSIEVLRRGKIGVGDIMHVLQQCADSSSGISRLAVTVRDTRSKYTSKHEDVPMDGPGQLLTHYAPCIPSFMVTASSFDALASKTELDEALPSSASSDNGAVSTSRDGRVMISTSRGVFCLADAVILDFKHLVRRCLERCGITGGWKAYRTLSDSGSSEEACREAFDALRWVETVDGAAVALFPFLSEYDDNAGADTAAATADKNEDCRKAAAPSHQHNLPYDELLAAIDDRLFRAASGEIARFSR